MNRFLSAILISLALITGSQAHVPAIDPGGSIFERLNQMEQLDKYGVEYHINGVCISACTMFLGLDKVCMEPNSILAFHSAAEYDAMGNPHISSFGNVVLQLVYPPKINEWLKKNKALTSLSLTTMSSEEAYSLGVERCPIDGSKDVH